MVWDGYLPNGGDKGVWPKPTPEEIPEIEKALDGLIAKYSAHPGFMGLLLGDEFQIPQHARLGLVTQYLLKKDPKHLPYYNNLPNYAFKSNTQYEEFVADYLKTVQPALFSWDAYKQMMGAGDENFYWHNLQIVQDQCAKAKIPFNQIIVSLKHMGYRECSEADLRWQVYTSLAYGSKGIQYFTYWSVKGLASGDSSALMTMDGKRDVKWEHVKKINHAIAKLGPTLVKLTPTGTYGTSPLMPGMKKLPNFAPVKKAEGGALLIGCFEDASRRQYTMVVNRSFTAKVTAKLTLDSRITSTAEISQETGKPLDAKPSAGKPLEVELLPGEGRLFVLPENGLTFNPPDEIFGGKDFAMANIGFDPKGENAKVTGKFFWRAKGETKFASLPIAAAAEKGQYQAAVPAAATKAPFEYYIEMQEDGQKPVTEPDAGAQGPSLATPDVTPPTAVAELASPIVKSYRVALSWKLATDDRAVAEYRVYRGAADTFPLDEKALLTKLPATAGEFTDSAPPVKQTAFYAVQATDVVGRNGEVRYLRVDVPESQPPANTLKVVATPGSKSVALAWSGELEPSVTAFEIHRAAGKDGAFQKIADITDIKTAKYLDKDSAFGSEYRYAVRPRNNAAQLGELGQVATASPLRYLKRINCGGLEIAAEDGVLWEADKKPGHATMASPSSSIWTIPAAVVGPGVVKDVYQSERWSNGQIHYTFGVDPGRYEVVLHFAETNRNFASKGKRVFDILINEEKAVEKVDIFTNAGAINTAWQFRKEVDVKERELTISLAANPTGPAIKGIEVRGLTGK